MRELVLWDAEEGLDRAFEDLDDLAQRCRFRDCEHRTEPGCAVREAIRTGALDAARLESFRHLQRELRYLEIRHDARARSEERKRWQTAGKEGRERARQKRRSG
jgi:ribosome biogenesis GTPase